MKTFSTHLTLITLTLSSPALGRGAETLPWEKDYASAIAKAKAEKRPLFLMLTATWCGPCKLLESQTLPAAQVLSAMKEFVWVKAYEDESLNKKFNLGGYPTLVFLDPSADRVLEKSSGYETPGPFLRHVIAARQAAGLLLTKELEALRAKSFTADQQKVQKLVERGDVQGLVTYLAPVRDDALRDNNFFVAKLRCPAELPIENVEATAYSELPVPKSGVLLLAVPREGRKVPLRVLAPGYKAIFAEVGVDDPLGVGSTEFALEPLSQRDASVFSGRVLTAAGLPAAKAIVRICDWDVMRTDDHGNFRFARVTPGTFVVRAEAPGGELQQEATFTAGQELKLDLPLKAVTTVGIRWALQRKEGVRDLTGPDVTTGEAYFSVDHSRFLLSRGAEVPQYYGSDFMLMADWKSVRQYIDKENLTALEASNPGQPIFWLFDASGHPNGLHAESARFEDISVINGGKPFDEKNYFKFLRGELVRKGAVYTVRCVRKDRFGKIEITDLTLIPKSSGPDTSN